MSMSCVVITNLPLSDENVCNITYDAWKRIVNDLTKHVAFLSLTEMCSTNKKTRLLSYSKLMRAPYLSKLNQKLLAWFSEPELVFMTSKTILRESMMVIQIVPFADSSMRTLSLNTFSSATQGFSAGDL